MSKDLTTDLDYEQRYEELRKAHERVLRQLDKAKTTKAEYTQAVYQAVMDAIPGLSIPKVPKPTKPAKSKLTPEYAVAVLSDWQLAKVTPSYNTEICEERIELYGDKLVELVNIQRAHHPVNELRVWLIGDIVEGELIFPGQQYLIDASLYSQVTVDGPRILTNFLRKMLTEFQSIHITAVIGNHGALGGRSRRDYNPESNADRMLYRIVQQLLAQETRITWDIPDGANERNWYAVDTVGSKSVLLFHGDQIRGGFAGYPWYGFGKKVMGWGVGAVPEHFDYAVCGHWHQPTSFVLNTKMVYCNGSTESHNTYAMEQLAAVGNPCQWLLFMHPENGITAEYRVWLDR